ncbi:hypothetical protein EDF74_2512 [Stenotrophomonas rhizophila]|jgi:hypothetical protein|uniref:hypothetical protein n=1 Tax=Stenotrophomonas TaxID=40323 RepID=UPI000F4C31A6|nr:MULTISPECIES: hypothetical protein [Stenotrophomonas]MCW6028275.1 hypothetical protein [Stenotrophomonas sp. SRS1]ROP76851.1 hypothetical protein EDF74_2512 [Stenotrophomonas rhizophila]
MNIVLQDATGRRLRLGGSCLVEDGVLYYRRMMLVAIGEGVRLAPSVLDVINASVAGSAWVLDDDVPTGVMTSLELSLHAMR